MSLPEIFELYASRASTTGKNPSVRCMFMIGRTDFEPDVRAMLLDPTIVPANYEGLPKVRTDQEPLGAGLWRCTVDYGLGDGNQATTNPGAGGSGSPDSGDSNQPGESDPLPFEVEVDIGGRTQHITQSLRTIKPASKKKKDTRDIPNHKGAIGVSKEGIEGCDIIVPELTWSESWTFLAAYVTWGYLRVLSDLVGRVNGEREPDPPRAYDDGIFRTFNPGEVMFMGARSRPVGQDRRSVIFTFKREPNVKDFRLGTGTENSTDEWTPINKDGHQYLWVEYEESADDTYLSKVPRAVHVEEVGRPGLEDKSGKPTNRVNFLQMGIGK